MPIECKRGEIYYVDWDPGRGSEQIGDRPALIIQNDLGNKFSPTTIVAACSTAKTKPYPFVVHFTSGESGLRRDGTVNLSQILTIDKSRLKAKAGSLPDYKMGEIDDAIHHSLGIEL